MGQIRKTRNFPRSSLKFSGEIQTEIRDLSGLLTKFAASKRTIHFHRMEKQRAVDKNDSCASNEHAVTTSWQTVQAEFPYRLNPLS